MGQYKEIDEYRQFTGPAESQKAINSFRGLLEGIVLDAEVNEREQQELRNWYANYRHLIDRHPFSEILPAIDDALADNILTSEEVQDLLWLCEQVSTTTYYDLVTSSVQTLHGLLHGVLADTEINENEIFQLNNWLEDHSILKGTYPFDEIYSLIATILADGVVTEDEKNLLKAFFAEFVDTRDSYNINAPDIAKLQEQYSVQGICAKDPDITILGHTFSFTGASSRATRNKIAEEIVSHGGIFNNSVTKKTEFLIVGAEGNPCWAFSCYGRKVEKAVAMRKEGAKIVIVNEHDFWSALEQDCAADAESEAIVS